jgi:hypothetical protein
VGTLTALVCTTIDGVTSVTFPVLGHSSARCSGRTHKTIEVRREEEEEGRVRELRRKENVEVFL